MGVTDFNLLYLYCREDSLTATSVSLLRALLSAGNLYITAGKGTSKRFDGLKRLLVRKNC